MAKNSTVLEVMSRVKKKQKKTKKRTLVLTDDSYVEFEKICKKLGVYPSEVVDEFIALVVEQERK